MKRSFNPSLRGPLVDIVLGLMVIAVAGIIWFSHTGTVKLAHAEADFRLQKNGNLAELERAIQLLDGARHDLTAIREQRDSQSSYADFLRRQIQQRQIDLQEAWEAQRPYEENALRLKEEIARLDHERRAFKTDLLETQWKIETRQEEVSGLEAQLAGLDGEAPSEQRPLSTALLEK